MEHTSHTSQTSDRPLRVPPLAWFVGIGLMAALAAVFIFNVAVSTVVYYGFIGLMFGGHFFMHGSHGGHGGHVDPRQPGSLDQQFGRACPRGST